MFMMLNIIVVYCLENVHENRKRILFAAAFQESSGLLREVYIITYRVTEYSKLKETPKDHQVQLLVLHRTTQKITQYVLKCCPNASWTPASLVL